MQAHVLRLFRKLYRLVPGYSDLGGPIRIYYLAHIRWKFYEVISSLNQESLKKSRDIIGFIILLDLILHIVSFLSVKINIMLLTIVVFISAYLVTLMILF